MKNVKITVGGKNYVPEDPESDCDESVLYTDYVICRTQSAGVFAGHLKSRSGQEGVLVNARRLWYWDGAASLSQLAMEGVKKPENCKFPCEVSMITLFGIIEIIPCTDKAQRSIRRVAVWAQ